MRLDPEGYETAALNHLLPDLQGRRVLEVGCGDGRLTLRYAERAGSVLAIDPDPTAIATFSDEIPFALRRHVDMRAGTIVTLGEPDRSFDVVLFAWSL
jgi:2-polyprenyl-3-methyl-5-hydroxy-6-metoxy-1,4-benzoquinol methylase